MAVLSTPGDPCDRESDCGAGQSCALSHIDTDLDGEDDSLAPFCQMQIVESLAPGQPCSSDAQCGTSSCALGRCTELCLDASDCAEGTLCSRMPRALGSARETSFGACLPAAGVISVPLTIDRASRAVIVPVPEHTISLTLVADGGEPWVDVGFTRVIAPDGEVLWEQPLERDHEYDQPLRVTVGAETTSVMIPSSTAAPLTPGVYRATVGAWLENGVSASAAPRLRAVYRLGLEGRMLDMNVHFLDLGQHPCLAAEGKLQAARATDDGTWRGVLDAWRDVFAPAGVILGNIEYHDVVGRPDLDAVDASELPALFALGGGGQPGLDVFVVRSLHPLGVLAQVGGRPGPVDPATARSGVVLSADAFCLFGQRDVGRILARATAGYLGLDESVSVDGVPDALDSTGRGAENLMFYRLGKDSELSSEQRAIVRGSPLLR